MGRIDATIIDARLLDNNQAKAPRSADEAG